MARWVLMCAAAIIGLRLLAQFTSIPVPIPDEETVLDRLAATRYSGLAGPDSPIVLVRITDGTLKHFRRPWGRFTELHTRLVERLHRAGARAIGFDMGIGFADDDEPTRRFLATVSAQKNVILGSSLPAPGHVDVVPVATTQQVRSLDVPTGFTDLFAGPGANWARRMPGPVVRLISLDAHIGTQIRHSFATRVAATYLGLSPDQIETTPRFIRLGERKVSLEGGRLRIDYPGRRPFPTYSYEALVDDKLVPPHLNLQNKLIVVGSFSAHSLPDWHQSPFGQTEGPVIQASAIHTLLTGRTLSPPPRGLDMVLALIAAGMAGLGFLGLPRGVALVAGLAFPVLLVVGASILFARGVWLPVGLAGLAAPVAAVVVWGLIPRGGRREDPVWTRATQVSALGDGPRATVPALGDGESQGDLLVDVARRVLNARYRDVKLLGRGGMGVVLQAFDAELGESVAVKVLSPLLADRKDLVSRFMREVRTLQTLKHPGIVRILDVGDNATYPYYSMELLAGLDLKGMLGEGETLELSRAQSIFGQLWAALAHVHAGGIVHRDLKPENLIILPGDKLKLLDFGLAHLPAATTLTADGAVMGTLRYMSPEQMAGAALEPTTDVFSAALVVYEALAGQMPFPDRGRMLDLSAAITPLGAIRRDAPMAVSALLMRCLHPEAGRRPATAAEVSAAWEEAWAVEPILP